MIKPFLNQKGYFLKDIIVWDGIITTLDIVNQFVKEPEDIRLANKKEIKKYLKHKD
jgi:hypothetical protein